MTKLIVSELGGLPVSKCNSRLCKYYRGTRSLEIGNVVHYCNAFRNGIPDEISYGDNKHMDLLPNQEDPITYRKGFDLDLIQPFPEKDMLRARFHGYNSLCSTIRDIYAQTDDPEIKLWCRYAMQMSKNIHIVTDSYKSALNKSGKSIRTKRHNWQLYADSGLEEG